MPPHTIAALRAGLPVLLLIRAPLDSVTSFAIVTRTRALPHLVSFVVHYEVLQPYLDRLFVVDFSTLITEPKTVLKAFSHHYGFPMNLDFDWPRVREEVFARIDHDNTSADGRLDERVVNRPHSGRAAWKAALVAELERSENRGWMERANAVYATFQARAAACVLAAEQAGGDRP